ncbi:DUF2793 domain-containing protein [Cohaesibacter sp. CAU 1516]|uniref:DUF2793 domain-containing protein n=1 Tax=Cohaesibacter sp. CAU 1516 TaxID=2576038 RepID=UPI0010FF38F9|nr:DUF2793 domain-containing protein [Cohaesibacter sp. CAU 1516]TLP43323.1 DUF2793 domain-containing protein [Cohaesibacter sp. CAU 1516]
MEQSPILSLPYIAGSQDQKHITHNEALQKLDVLTQLTVSNASLTTPPTDPTEGDRYIVAPSATGVWSGRSGQIAAFQNGAWAYYDPQEGWRVWNCDEGRLLGWTGSDWTPVGGNPEEIQNANHVGVNASADDTNRLSVASAASLFTHEGAGHQIKVNKNAAGDTASLLFQTNWSGRAEMGLNGSDNWSMKVSADGVTWAEPLKLDKDNGRVVISNSNPTARLIFSTAVQYAISAASRFDFDAVAWNAGNPVGYGPQTTGVNQGGYICPYDGLYLINIAVQTGGGSIPFRTELLKNTALLRRMFLGNDATTAGYGTFTPCETVLAFCAAGDVISMQVDSRDSGAVIWSAGSYLEIAYLGDA